MTSDDLDFASGVSNWVGSAGIVNGFLDEIVDIIIVGFNSQDDSAVRAGLNMAD